MKKYSYDEAVEVLRKFGEGDLNYSWGEMGLAWSVVSKKIVGLLEKNEETARREGLAEFRRLSGL